MKEEDDVLVGEGEVVVEVECCCSGEKSLRARKLLKTFSTSA